MFKSIKKTGQAFLEIDTADMPRFKRMLIRAAQIPYACIRDVSDGHFSLQAMSLVYTTLITLVPLLAISFSVLKGFGVHNEIEPFLSGMLAGLGPEKSAEVTGKVIEFVDNVKVGVLGVIGLALLLYAVIALMQKIEAAFNYIWRVGEDRTFSQRFSDYLSVLLMGPLLLFISAGLTATVRNSGFLESLGYISWALSLLNFSSFFLPWLIMAAGFTFFYVYMPNTKVKISAAFVGGLVTALLWKIISYVFSSFIATSANYVAIYAAFATLIVFMIWLYVSWLVILVGANVSFYTQYPRYLRVNRTPMVLSPHMRMMLGLSVLTLISKAYYNRESQWTLDRLSRRLNVPVLAIQKVVEILEDGGILIAATKDEPMTFIPAIPLDNTPLQLIIDVLEKQGREGWMQTERMNFTSEARNVMEEMDKARQKHITGKTVMEVLVGPDKNE